MAGKQEGMPRARARAYHADFAVEIGLRAQPRHRAFGVAYDLSIGNTALGAYFGGDVVRLALAGAMKEVMADSRIPMMRELARRLAVPLIPGVC